jgi:hypothetical protein
VRLRKIRRSIAKKFTCDSKSRASRLTESKNQITSLAMIRKKLPSAIAPDACIGSAAAKSAQRAAMRVRAIANCVLRQCFLVRQTHLQGAGKISAVSCGVPSHALANWCARQVLPRGRQKTPPKSLKNNEKSSPGFVLRVVQRIESRSASGYGIGVGEWG